MADTMHIRIWCPALRRRLASASSVRGADPGWDGDNELPMQGLCTDHHTLRSGILTSGKA